ARTKATQMRVGDFGMLYCTERHAFTTPFLVFSQPDPKREVSDVWPGTWALPFRIHALGSPARLLDTDRLARLLPSLAKGLTWDKLLPVAPTTIFSPASVSRDDWEILLTNLVSEDSD